MKKGLMMVVSALLATSNCFAEESDTLKIVDMEEITVIAAPKENRKLREQPAAVTLLSQKELQASQVGGIKNLTAVVPNMFIPDYGILLAWRNRINISFYLNISIFICFSF